MIIQVANAAGPDDCHRLIVVYDRHVDRTKVMDQTGNPVVYWDQLGGEPDAAEIVPRLVQKCLCTLSDRLPFAAPLYPETVILTALGVGGYHSRHADNVRQNEQGDWVANHTPQRDVTAIYYLNDAFDGGEIVFERQQLAVRPRPGFLLAFPSDADHLHEVLPVRCGLRYTLAIWFTKQQCFALSMTALDAPAIAVCASVRSGELL